MSELKVKIGEEYKIKIEKGKDFESSIFNELYERASVNINDIISQADQKRNLDIKTDFSILDDYNNIIAFTGERGTGKSSSMVSFAEALINKNNEAVGGYFKKFDNISKKDFLSIEMIDPSLFVEKDTLLEIIISKMFLKFQKDLDFKNNSDLDYDKKRELITLFQKVFENLKTLHGDKKQIYDYEAIETLSKLANGTNLKENFNQLTEKYLEYFGIKEGFLLIAIDDFDLNVKGAYFMLEDMRQYLIQKNIIILLASKMEQLQDSIKQSIISNYKELLQIDKENISDSPEKKSIKYLDKLFPIAHRIITPNIYSLFDSSENKLYLNKITENSNKFIVYDKDNNEIINSSSIEKGLLEFIYTNNDLFISKSKFYLSSIMPNTLRELSNFIGFLSISKNIHDLKNYFIIEIDNNLSPKYSSLFIELDSIDIIYVNQYIVNWLGKNHPTIIDFLMPNKLDSRVRYTENQLKIDQIIKSTNHQNVTFADVLCLINQIEKESLIIESENIKLIYYLKLYYSIRYYISRNKYSFYHLTNTLITNELIKIIPAQRSERKDRHVFQIHQFDKLLDKLSKNELKIDDYYWLSFFFGELGKPNAKYRNDELVFYKIPINKTGNQYKEVKFNALSFIVNCLEPDLVKERFLPENQWDQENKLYNKIIEWKAKLNDEDYYIFFNIQFLDELIMLWRNYNFNYKKSIGSTYADAMQVYFSKNTFDFIFEEIKIKYPYLKVSIDVFYNNPILEYWRENLDKINSLLNDVFNSESDQEETDAKYRYVNQGYNSIQRKIINDYIDNLPKRKDKKSTLTRLIKKMDENKFKTEYSSQISFYKSSLGKSKVEDEEIVNTIIDYLRNILLING